VGNCDTQIMLGVTEQEGADFFSMRSGDSTVRVDSTMTVRKTIAVAQLIPQYRKTDGLGRRRLLTPDEILRFPNDELLIILRGENVLRAKKFDYTCHPYAKRLVRSSIFEYSPDPIRAFRAEPDMHNSIQTGPDKSDGPRTEPEDRQAPQTEKKSTAKLFAVAKPPEEF